MAVSILKAEQIAATGLALLQREIVLPGLVWRNAGGDFRGAKNDTVSLRVPALAGVGRTNALRATGSDRLIVLDDLSETKVDVTLDTNVYKGVAITDEVLTLDLLNFTDQITSSLVRAVVEGVENKLATTITGASYATGNSFSALEADDPYKVLIRARKILNNRSVPLDGRVVVVGSDAEEWILNSDHLNQFDNSGDNLALRRAEIGRLAGFNIVTSLAIPANHIYVFHKTAFVLSTQAPVIPPSVTFGANVSDHDLALRFMRDYDAMYQQDRAIINTWVGTGVVQDDLDNDPSTATKGLVRAVKIVVSDLGS